MLLQRFATGLLGPTFLSGNEFSELVKLASGLGLLPKPRPTSSINLRPQVYVVLRVPGLAQPVVCYSAAEYYKVLPHFTPESVSHSSLQQGKPESIALQPEWISQQDHDRDGIFSKWSDIPVRGQDIGSRPFVSVCKLHWWHLAPNWWHLALMQECSNAANSGGA